ncbi:MAG: hypothetical protein M1821_007410 [Bathelium mastoideum]|nr:MAG: hypothetical protein M1821_007410 [Bathelium mastoideum]
MPSNSIVALRARWMLHLPGENSFQAISVEVPSLRESQYSAIAKGLVSAEIQLTTDQSTDHSRLVRLQALLSHSWINWWLESIAHLAQRTTPLYAVLFLILPIHSGYLVRSDIFQCRLVGWQSTILILSRNEPGQTVTATPAVSFNGDIHGIFGNAVSGIVLETRGIEDEVSVLLDGLARRLALPWVIEGPFFRRRVAIIDGGFKFGFRSHIFAAAAALGIDLVILDRPKDWLRTASSYIAELVTMDMTPDAHLPNRIAEAIRSCQYPIDGITTFTDNFLCATAQVAGMLSFPTSSVEAYEVAVDKKKTRKLAPLPIAGNADIQRKADGSMRDTSLIVKPAHGGGSWAVFLTKSHQEVIAAEDFIRKLGTDPTVEQYIEGPEVDVNIVLQDDAVLFAEVCDNSPTTAEGFPSQSGVNSWIETGTRCPSGLPSEELALLRNTTTSCLLKAGFRTGVFHCEARVVHSAAAYYLTESRDMRLRLAEHHDSEPPMVAIIELNARAPGKEEAERVNYGSGVDFAALQLLAACGDYCRFSALATPFSRIAEWWGGGYVVAEKGGTFVPDVMFEELTNLSPGLMKGVVRWTVFFRHGDYIEDSITTGKSLWVAWYLVRSDVSRSHLEDVLMHVRNSLKFDIV